MKKGESMEPSSAWEVVGSIAKKDGVQGVLLLILCALIYNGQREAREERKAFQTALGTAQAQVVQAHGQTVQIATQAAEALRASTAVLADNTRVMERLAYRRGGG